MPYNKEMTKEIRRELGISQMHLAYHLGTDTRTISSWENGHTSPKIRILDQIYEFCLDRKVKSFSPYVGLDGTKYAVQVKERKN